jgi:hypothetical protein
MMRLWYEKKFSGLHLSLFFVLGSVFGGYFLGRFVTCPDCPSGAITPNTGKQQEQKKTQPTSREYYYNCYSPYYIPAPRVELDPLQKVDVVLPVDPWKNNPSSFWVAPGGPEEQLMTVVDEMKCRAAINFEGLDVPPNPGYTDEQRNSLNLFGLSPRCYRYWRYMPTAHQFMSLYSYGASIFGQDPYSAAGLFVGGMDRTFLDFVLVTEPVAVTFVEFGTGVGLTSVYLGITAKLRKGTLHTFDTTDNRSSTAKEVWNDVFMVRHTDDVLEANGEVCKAYACEPANVATVTTIPHANIWVMNRGVSLKAVYLYAKLAPVTGVALVSDMTLDPAQFDQYDQVFQYYGWESVYKDFAESLGTSLRAWKRVQTTATPEVLAKLKEPTLQFPAKLVLTERKI